MRSLEVALIEWPQGRDAGGPRVIGHVTDPEIVARVRGHIADARRRELAHLEPSLRPAPKGRTSDEPDSGDLGT